VVLFGSRVRGDAGPDSDYDVAVFLRDMPDRMVEMNRPADLSTAILDRSGQGMPAGCRKRAIQIQMGRLRRGHRKRRSLERVDLAEVSLLALGQW
jgi:predicted nucleotidyltransferase